MEKIKITILKSNSRAKLPSRGSTGAAGYDLYADTDEDIRIAPCETKLVSAGFSAAIPEGYFIGIFARSGLASKKGLRPANCVGVVDSDYRGTVTVALHNDSGSEQVISPGERMAQMVIMPCITADFIETDSLSGTERGEGGFGSTGGF